MSARWFALWFAALLFPNPAATESGQEFTPIVPQGIQIKLWVAKVDARSLTSKKVALGEDLFHDRNLSADGSVSCASCHDPAIGYADHNRVAVGVGKHAGVRNVPTLFNTVFSGFLFWDGRARSFEEQAVAPLRNRLEMGPQTEDEVAARLNENPRYRKRFSVIYGEDAITAPMLLNALGAFERTLFSADSEFDRFLAHKPSAFSAAALRGWSLFRGRAGCIRCHTFEPDHPFFTDFQFHNTGVSARKQGYESVERAAEKARTPIELTKIAEDPVMAGLGRFRITGNRGDIGAFKTPTLRDVALTAPYMHDGSLSSLAAVIAYYNQGGTPNAHLAPELRALHLDERSQSDLAAFLESLTGSEALRKASERLR